MRGKHRPTLESAEIQQTTRQVQNYANVFTAELSGSEESEGSQYRSRESTPSSSSSIDEETKQYLVDNGHTYQYKLKKDSVRWLVNDYDVYQAFFNYQDAAINYSTDQPNESTFVRDTIDTFFRSFLPNSPLTKSMGAYAMIFASSKRFTRLDPSFKNHEAKPNKTKHANELVKLCREPKDSMKAMHNDDYSGVLVKGNRCDKLQIIVHSSAVKLRNCPLPTTHILDSTVSMRSPIIVKVSKRRLDKNNPDVQRALRRLF
ncbi:MAG: hypothetical protein EXX96DRAFT_621469 [Benjaminiella poitrasii]|nr:MAG: hypothetical protein EXX96DRAFT_621469 [Benjaminiella poitrasii]